MTDSYTERQKRPWTDAEDARLLREYTNAANNGLLDGLAAAMGRTKPFICRRAGVLGLTNRNRPKFYEQGNDRFRRYVATHGHPRGMLGKNHSDSSKAKMEVAQRKRWDEMTQAERDALADAQIDGRKRNPHQFTEPGDAKKSWKAGWRVIGGQRCYFRSRWEANYARYLQHLVETCKIRGWEHEPKTFWFDGIRRGVCSYKPDFRVTMPDGSIEWHEVKGWMDARSRTTLKRMAKYHPAEKIVLVDSKPYAAIQRDHRALKGWE